MDAPSLLTSWRLEPLQLVPTLLVAALYARRVRTLRRRGTPVEPWRPWLFGLGIGLVLLALASPIDAFGEEEFLSFHMLHHDSIHALEHLLFFTCGGLMWAPVLEVLPAPEWFGTGWKLGYIVAVRLIETVLGNVFIWSGKVFYPYYEHAHPRWGISGLHDQGLAGAVMMLEGSIVTIAALAWLFLRLASEGELRQQLIERGLDPRAVQRAVRYGRAEEFSQPR